VSLLDGSTDDLRARLEGAPEDAAALLVALRQIARTLG